LLLLTSGFRTGRGRGGWAARGNAAGGEYVGILLQVWVLLLDLKTAVGLKWVEDIQVSAMSDEARAKQAQEGVLVILICGMLLLLSLRSSLALPHLSGIHLRRSVKRKTAQRTTKMGNRLPIITHMLPSFMGYGSFKITAVTKMTPHNRNWMPVKVWMVVEGTVSMISRRSSQPGKCLLFSELK